MADRTLTKNYLRDAKANSEDPHGVEEQLAWLEARRVELSAEVDSGDWEMEQSAIEGAQATGRRKQTAKSRLAAVIAAMEQLEDVPGAPGKGVLLIPLFGGVED